MRKRILSLVLACAMLLTLSGSMAEAAITLPAEEEGQLTLQDLQEMNGGEVNVYTENGSVTFVGGTCTTEPVLTFEDAAGVISSMMDLLGGDENMQLEPWRVLNDTAGNLYYVFRQVSDDVLMLGGAVKVITDQDGKMLGLTSSLLAAPAVDEAQGDGENVTAEQAEELVIAHGKEAGLGKMDPIKGLTAKTVLPIDREPDIEKEFIETRFVWVVYTNNPTANPAGVDLPFLAHYITLGGEYLYSLPTVVPGDSTGEAGYNAEYVFQFMEPAEYTGYVDYSDGTEREITVTLMRDSRTGMYYLGNIEHKIVVADCWEFLYNHGNVVLEYSPDNLEWDQTSLMSLYQYCKAYDYYKEIGWTGADGNNTPMIVLKGFCDKDHNPVDNAAYAGKFYGWMTFLSSSINDFAQCLDVCAHEFTHCVTEAVMTHNAYSNDYGAINEAISDIHGNLCEQMAGGTEDTDWILGENSKDPVRCMSDPNSFEQPSYTWDIYYFARAKDPTDTNDHGGVHFNSGILNHIAYQLCNDGGMSFEDARAYWFAVDCAMVPGSDYPQLKELLPWVMTITGLDKYQKTLGEAISAARLGENNPPDPIEEDKAMLILNLPDNEVFNNGKWVMQVATINIDALKEKLQKIKEDLASGNLDEYPELIRMLNNPIEAIETKAEEKGGLLSRIVNKVTEKLAPQQAEPEENPKLAELTQWLMTQIQEVVYSGMASAGQDGHVIRMMGKPGRTVPILMYASIDHGGAVVELQKYVIYLNGSWYDVSGLLSDLQTLKENGLSNPLDSIRILFENELTSKLIETLMGSGSIENAVNMISMDVKGGETFEIPNEGLEKIDLSDGIRNKTLDDDRVPNDRKSRPKTDGTEEEGKGGEKE